MRPAPSLSCLLYEKPFSDSSSLARHRRIHSGKRPYKCPYADCQKTFTRRTTLTRHQNHHTGTVEEAAAATAAALASRPPIGRPGRPTHSEGGDYSNTVSPMSTPAQSPRDLSMSPNSELPPIPSMHRQTNDYSFVTGSLPLHMRGDMHHATSPRMPTASSAPLSSMGVRPTSHPVRYGLPPVLEPPTLSERGSGSVNGSPHMTNSTWSPSQSSLASPTHGDGFMYHDYHAAAQMAPHHIYYPSSAIRRPQSTEPAVDPYDMKHHRMGGEVWTAS